MAKLTILGDGSFGTALAQVLATNGHTISLWCFNPQIAASIKERRCNEIYLPAIELHSSIHPIISLKEALNGDPSWIIEAIPVAYMRSVLSQIKNIPSPTPWVIASKGIEAETHLLPSEILIDTLKQDVPHVILSGPSFARELATGVPTGITLASKDLSLAEEFQKIISSPSVYTDISQDPLDTQLCGAFKNILALALGILDGAGYGANTQALVFTKGVQELAQFIKAKGGQEKNIMHLAGIGDLTMTAYSSQSRNKTLGRAIGKKEYLEKELPYTEGINTLKSILAVSQELPLFSTVARVVFEQKPIESIIATCR